MRHTRPAITRRDLILSSGGGTRREPTADDVIRTRPVTLTLREEHPHSQRLPYHYARSILQ